MTKQKSEKDTVQKTKICPKHNTEMVSILAGGTIVPVLDEEGFEVSQKEEDIYVLVCPECDMEELQREQDKFFMSPYVDSGKKIEERLKSQKNDRLNTIKDGIIEKYSGRFANNSDIPISVAKAYVQSAISSQICRIVAGDSRGRVLPNLGFLWIGPSGIGKTPALDAIISPVEKLLRDGSIYNYDKIYNRVTGEFLIHSIAHIKGEQRHNIALIWDEVSTLAKSAYNRSTSSLFETLNALYDGRLPGSGSVSRGDDGASNVYAGIFIMSGTPIFLKYIDEDFWNIGIGTRLDFLPYESLPPSDILPDPKEGHRIADEFIDDLLKIRKVVKVKWLPEMWQKYNEYQKKIISEVRMVQEDLDSSLIQENFEVISRSKFPLKVLKYSIIYASSRMNFTDSGLLYVDVEDLENAIRDVEEYHKNMLLVYRQWQSMNQKFDITTLIEKLKKAYKTIAKKAEKSYRVDFIDQKDDSYSLAVPDKEGAWVKHSDLLRQSHMKATGYGSFDEIITTLVERDEFIKRECRVYTTWKGRNGSKTRTLTAAIFYKIKED